MADILIFHAVEVHGDVIAIIAYYGSRAKGLASPGSDLDLFYIADEGQAASLSSQFVLDGLPYDFWPVSWALAEEIAQARSGRPWAVAASLIADARVLYHRCQADLERFQGLQARILELTRPESHPAMVARALEEFRQTLFQLGQIRLAAIAGDRAGLGWAAWKFVHSVANCLALVNQTYFSQGWGANLPQILAMPQRPEGLEEMLQGILMAPDPAGVPPQAERLARSVREILLAEQAALGSPAAPQEVFQDFYFFVYEYVHKVLAACEREDRLAAAAAAFHLQEEICQLMNTAAQGFAATDFNLLGEYAGAYHEAGLPDLLEPASQGDLAVLAAQVLLLDERMRAWLERHAVPLNVLSGPEDLRRFLHRRDPP